MAEQGRVEVSKAFKDNVIERLKQAYAHDHLEVEEFENRLVMATNTKSRRELEALVSDLPEVKEEKKAEIPSPPVNKGRVKSSGVILSILGGVHRKGRWRPPRNLKVFIALGGVDLNFTKAELAPGVTEIMIFCAMGGVDIVVPEGVNVDAHCLSVMGGFEDFSNGLDYPEAPTLKIRGVVMMGGVTVKPPKKKMLDKILKRLGIEE